MANNNKHTGPNVPALRFPEFSGEWESIKLGDVLKLKGGYAFKSEKFQDSGVPVVRISNLPQNSYSVDLSDCVYYECGNYQNYTVKNGDLLIAMSGATTGKTAIYRYDYPAYLNQRVGLFAPKELVHNQFLYPIVESKTFISQLGSKLVAGAQPNISSQDIETIAVGLPSKEEQIKIAHLFELLNQKIENQTKIIEDLKKLKSAIIEKLFARGGDAVLISDLITQVSKRNNTDCNLPVLSVNNRLGFIRQSEQFEDRTVASDDTSNYKVVSTDDFAFNPARINVGSIARLKSETKGIVSPMYICFHSNDRVRPEYFEYFFETKYFYSEMQKRLEGSVRLCLSWEGLCNISISLPNIEQQIEIGKKISTIAAKIDLEERYLQNLKLQKQHLLQHMFI